MIQKLFWSGKKNGVDFLLSPLLQGKKKKKKNLLLMSLLTILLFGGINLS